MTTYDGGKNGAGVWQTIINQMPPHRIFIEAFLGSGAVIRRKRSAVVNIGIEIDPVTVAAVHPLLTAVDVFQADAVEWLRDYPAGADVLIYADPPYLRSTRSCQRDLYRHEFATEAEHVALLELAKSSPAMWMISGYWSDLYADMLKDWRVVTYAAGTRRGVRMEYLWCNFPAPVELHDYSFVGSDRTDRQRIKRKKERWTAKLLKMSAIERRAILEACHEVKLKTSASPAHDCDKEIRANEWAMSGFRQTGDQWKCSCGKVYEHINDEAEGGAWQPSSTADAVANGCALDLLKGETCDLAAFPLPST